MKIIINCFHTVSILGVLACGFMTGVPQRKGKCSSTMHNTAISLKSSFGDSEPFGAGSEGSDREDANKFLNSKENTSKFVKGDKLQALRQKVLNLRGELMEAKVESKTTDNSKKVLELERAILKAQQKDAEFVYAISVERMDDAYLEGEKYEAEQHRKAAINARQALPQFNLQGLWVGKYGDNGYEMINVTYIGDTLYAHKVTGYKSVPKGAVSFSVDLSPVVKKEELLEPIELTDTAAKQWGVKYLTRFAGKGQVASEGFQNAQFIEGQLILVNQFFSFAWIPIGHQVFFGRPSPELTIQLLREAEKNNCDDIEEAREQLSRCMEETLILEEESSCDDGMLNQIESYKAPGCFE